MYSITKKMLPQHSETPKSSVLATWLRTTKIVPGNNKEHLFYLSLADFIRKLLGKLRPNPTFKPHFSGQGSFTGVLQPVPVRR